MQDRCTICIERTIGLELLGAVGRVESRSVRLEIVVILMQDRCTICAERTIGLKIILDASNGPPPWRGSCGTSFRSVWMQDRCMVCAIRTFGSEIVLDELDGTPW
jgi:hypothetical protein